MPRLFVAAVPPDEVLDALEQLPRPSGPGVRYTTRAQWHVTLRFLGEADLDRAVAALVALDAPRATAVVGPVVSRLGRDVVCLPVAGLDELAAAVRSATSGVGEPADPRPFAGHLTLARLKRRAACGVAGERFSARFEVSDVHLIRSTLSSSGPSYETVAVRALHQP